MTDNAKSEAPLVIQPPTRGTQEEVQALVDAMWQLLDDMSELGQCVSLAAKARARIAYEPFREDDPYDDWMSFEKANEIMDYLERRK